jgi:hypothetical protein
MSKVGKRLSVFQKKQKRMAEHQAREREKVLAGKRVITDNCSLIT